VILRPDQRKPARMRRDSMNPSNVSILFISFQTLSRTIIPPDRRLTRWRTGSSFAGRRCSTAFAFSRWSSWHHTPALLGIFHRGCDTSAYGAAAATTRAPRTRRAVAATPATAAADAPRSDRRSQGRALSLIALNCGGGPACSPGARIACGLG